MDAIARIEAWTDGKTFDDYLADDMLRAAVERSLEIVSEASRHIPAEAKRRHPEVTWRCVAGFGNVDQLPGAGLRAESQRSGAKNGFRTGRRDRWPQSSYSALRVFRSSTKVWRICLV